MISAAIGASAALGGTLLAHLLRSRGERVRDDQAGRRQSYLDFVLALGDAHSRLRLVADGARSPAELRRETTLVMSGSGAYEAREKFLMAAAPTVVGAGEVAFNRIVQLRDAVRDGARPGSAKFHDAYHDLSAATWQLRQAVRHDLGTARLTLTDVGKLSWDSRQHCEVCQGQAPAVERQRPPEASATTDPARATLG